MFRSLLCVAALTFAFAALPFGQARAADSIINVVNETNAGIRVTAATPHGHAVQWCVGANERVRHTVPFQAAGLNFDLMGPGCTGMVQQHTMWLFPGNLAPWMQEKIALRVRLIKGALKIDHVM